MTHGENHRDAVASGRVWSPRRACGWVGSSRGGSGGRALMSGGHRRPSGCRPSGGGVKRPRHCRDCHPPVPSRELEDAARPRQGATDVPSTPAEGASRGASKSSLGSPRARLPTPLPCGRGTNSHFPESWASFWQTASAKVLNLEDFARQTFPGSGREA